MKATDEELVRAAKLGDEAAFTALYDRHKGRVRNVIQRVLRDYPNDVEDAVQSAFMKAFRAIGTFSGDAQFGTWLHRVAMNEACMTLRHFQARPHGASRQAPLEYEAEDGQMVTVDVVTEERGYAAFEARQMVKRLLPGLSKGTADAIEARYLKELNCEESAALCGISVSGIKSAVLRGLERMRQRMDDLDNGVVVPEDLAPKVAEKKRCSPCEEAGRFRYADGEHEGTPMCSWCLREAKAEAAAPAPIIRAHKTNGFPGSFAAKICQCGCGESFVPTAPPQKFAPGHRSGTTVIARAKAPKPAPVIARPTRNDTGPMVTLTIPVTALDRIWNSRTPEEKARCAEILLASM